MADDLLSTVLGSIDKYVKNLDKSQELVDAILGKQKEAQADLEKQTANAGVPDGRGGRDTPITIEARELAELKAQNDARKAASAMGSNMEDSSEILTSLAAEVRSSAVNAINAAKVVDEKTSTKLFDNPIKYIYDQVTLKGAENTAEAAKYRYTVAKDSLATVQALTQELPKTTAAIAATKTAATVQSKVEATQAAINAAVDTVKIQNAAYDIRGLETLNNMNAQQIQALGQKFSVVNQQKHLEISQANYNLHKQQVELDMQIKQENLAEKKLKDQELQDLANLVKKGASQLGVTSVAAMPHTKILQMLQLKADGFQEYLKAGMLSESTGAPTVSDNAGDVAKVLITTRAPLNPVQDKIKQLFKSMIGDASDPAGAAIKTYRHDVTKLDQVAEAAGKMAVIKAKEQMASIDYRDQSNIYSAPPLDTITGIPAVANSELYKTVFVPQANGGGLKEFNPEQLLAMTATAIKNKQISYKQASSDLHTLFTAVVLQNNKLHSYKGFGLPEQSSFNVPLENRLGITTRRNLMDPKEIDSILNSKLATPLFYSDNPFGGGFR